MRQENAIFAGELSSHFYFRENYYADNGMIPMLMMLEHIITERKPLSQLLAYYRSKYFASPEINYKVSDVSKILAHVEEHYKDKASRIYHIDGLSVDFLNWRFNLRGSNTEPLIRLNAEAKSQEILDKQLKEVESVITSEEF
jgi:phosphomannomutase